jgi:hypothetical protein
VKASRIQIMMQQNCQPPEVDEIPMNNLDQAGQRFRKWTSSD